MNAQCCAHPLLDDDCTWPACDQYVRKETTNMSVARVCQYCHYLGTAIIKGKARDFCSLDDNPVKQISTHTCARYEQSYPAKQI